ncbi:uncharacterized UDP-glucosyltransferase YjiC-like [Tetranychus urticae]|uniref:UDP-glycosyltransferase 205A2 n=1 Tax=Tetranychus urticae TaxID=32264 RepID=T1KGL7_TETUR|nr:uncharacterized UDP-glucosyltransferase YjiC-like [Tetranychus urticae]AHX56911.1 UDP-glycosyltransferase 205A2 [Tetranychus urticae]
MAPLKILLSAMDGQGHVNAVLGLAGILKQHNHELIFALSPAWESSIKSKGYQFIALKKDKVEEENKSENPFESLLNFLNQQLEILRKEPMEALQQFDQQKLVSTYLGFTSDFMALDKPFEKVIEQIKPDLIIIDYVYRIPTLIKTKIPWIQLWSCNPIAVYKESCPPEGTGFSVYSPKEEWSEYRKLYSIKYAPLREMLNEFMINSGVEPYKEHESMALFESPYLNIYNYPEALDYTDVAPRPDKWYRMDAVIREPDDKEPFKVPENLINKPGKLIYFSLGSMGSVDLDLMKRVIGCLAKSPHRFIISKGPHHKQIDLPDNMWGDRYVNQIGILPHVDLVITHGGNNTFIESLYFAKPMIIMPIWYDQRDNAQRMVDKQLGIRINTFNFTDDQLLDGIEKLINDEKLHERLTQISHDMRNTKTHDEISKLIEKTVLSSKNQ